MLGQSQAEKEITDTIQCGSAAIIKAMAYTILIDANVPELGDFSSWDIGCVLPAMR